MRETPFLFDLRPFRGTGALAPEGAEGNCWRLCSPRRKRPGLEKIRLPRKTHGIQHLCLLRSSSLVPLGQGTASPTTSASATQTEMIPRRKQRNLWLKKQQTNLAGPPRRRRLRRRDRHVGRPSHAENHRRPDRESSLAKGPSCPWAPARGQDHRHLHRQPVAGHGPGRTGDSQRPGGRNLRPRIQRQDHPGPARGRPVAAQRRHRRLHRRRTRPGPQSGPRSWASSWKRCWSASPAAAKRPCTSQKCSSAPTPWT